MAQFLLPGDPDQYEVDRAILRSMSREESLWWPVTRLAESLRLGDAGVLLRLESTAPDMMVDLGGIIALSRVVAMPQQIPTPNPDLWTVRPPLGAWFVPLEVQEVRLSPDAAMIGRETLRKSPLLSKLGLGVRRGGTESRLNHDQFDEVRKLWRREAIQTLR